MGYPRNTPDFFPLQVMNRILGGATSARLYMNLRQDKGYTYGATSAFSYRRGAGPFVAQAAVQGFSTKESVIEFLKELHGIRGGIPVSPEEIESARQAIIRGFPRGFETPEQIAASLEAVVIYELPDDYFNSYTQKIAAVKLDDLNRVAKQYLHPDRMAIVIVGDRKSIEPPLRTVEGYGANLVFVDAEGRPAGPPSGVNHTVSSSRWTPMRRLPALPRSPVPSRPALPWPSRAPRANGWRRNCAARCRRDRCGCETTG